MQYASMAKWAVEDFTTKHIRKVEVCGIKDVARNLVLPIDERLAFTYIIVFSYNFSLLASSRIA